MKGSMAAGLIAAGLAACAQAKPQLGVAPNDIPLCDFAAYERRTPPPGPLLIDRTPGSVTPVPVDSVIYVDPAIRRAAVVQSVTATRTEADTVEIAVRYRNCTGAPLRLSSRTSFLREDQSAAEPQSAWGAVHIPPFSMGVYTEKSVGTVEVAHFLVEVRGDQ